MIDEGWVLETVHVVVQARASCWMPSRDPRPDFGYAKGSLSGGSLVCQLQLHNPFIGWRSSPSVATLLSRSSESTALRLPYGLIMTETRSSPPRRSLSLRALAESPA